MKAVKLLIFPDWVVAAMNDHGLTFSDGKDLKNLGSILSTRDLIIYTALNSLLYHDVMESLLCSLRETRSGFDLDEIEELFTQSDRRLDAAYSEIATTLFDPDVHGYKDLLAMLTDADCNTLRLHAEGVAGDTVYVSLVPTSMTRSEAIASSLESLVSVLNDQSPIHMERTSLFDLYLHHTV